LDFDTKYSEVNISKTNSIVLKSKYDEISLGTVKKLYGDIEYGDLDIKFMDSLNFFY